MLTSNDPINGEILSGSSGATAPMSFQFFVSPWLIEEACSAVFVRLKRIAIELASWEQSSVVELSRYIPALDDQKTSLNLDLRAVALVDQASERVVSLRSVASSAEVTRTFIEYLGHGTASPSIGIYVPCTAMHCPESCVHRQPT